MARATASSATASVPVCPDPAVGFNWVGQGRRAAPMAVAEQLLRQALRRDASDCSSRRQLGGLLYDQSRFDEALETLDPLTRAGDGGALRILGLCLMAQGEIAGARQALTAALAAGVTGVRSQLAGAIAKLDGPEAAARLTRQALRASPDDAYALELEARRWLAAGRPDRLERLCRSLLRRGGRNAAIYALLASAEAARGDEPAVRRLVDYDRMLSVTALTRPNLAALAAEILGHANAGSPHRTYATHGGVRIDDALTLDAPCLLALADDLRAALDGYLARAPADDAGPLSDYRGEAVTLKLWALVLDEGAFEEWHLHPSGVASGVFYVRCAADVGLLEFGLVPIGPKPSPPDWRRQVGPRPGRLVMFPSSFAHRTTPAAGATLRISVAFDVVRA